MPNCEGEEGRVLNVFELSWDVGVYQKLRPHTTTDMKTFWGFDGTSKLPGWAPASVKLFRESDFFQGKLPSEFPYLTAGVPVFTPVALAALEDLLKPHGELLPLQSQDGAFYAYNVTAVVDALDISQSDIKFMEDCSRIVIVNRYAFRQDQLTGIPIFKVPQLRKGRVFVTDEFVQRVNDQGLTGFRFRHLWSSSSWQDG